MTTSPETIEALVGWLLDQPVGDRTVEWFRSGAEWAIAWHAGRTVEDVHDEVTSRIVAATSVALPSVAPPHPTPVSDAIPHVDRAELLRMAMEADAPSPESFGPGYLGLRVTRPGAYPAQREPGRSMSAEAEALAESGDPLAAPIPPDELDALRAEREAQRQADMSQEQHRHDDH